MKIITCSILIFLFIWCGADSYAQDKVVVIPLQAELDEKSLRALCRGYDFIGESPPPEFKCPPKLVFVTSEPYNGYLGGVSGADNYCQYHANQSEITKGRVFKAWISGYGSSPDVSFIQSQTPYILTCQLGPTGGVVANDWADLTSGNIAIPIHYTEKGCLSVVTLEVWTNTNYQGTQDSPIGDCWTGEGSWRTNSSSSYGQVGSAYETDQAWTDIGSTGRGCNELKYLYCFEQ